MSFPSDFDAPFDFTFETGDVPAQAVVPDQIDFSRMDITIGERSEISKRHNFVIGTDGDVSFDETQAHAVMTSIIERRRGYWADRNHGSDLFELRSLTARTPSQAQAMIAASIAQLEQDNSITETTIVVQVNRSTGQLRSDVRWTTPTGTPGSSTLDL